MQAYVPCSMHPPMASAKELVPYLQSLPPVIKPALKKRCGIYTYALATESLHFLAFNGNTINLVCVCVCYDGLLHECVPFLVGSYLPKQSNIATLFFYNTSFCVIGTAHYKG